MLMISVNENTKLITLTDIIKNELKVIIPLTEYNKALIEHIKDYETISIDGKVYDNPLTRDR